ncbi:dTDP-4-dehydrorhamnose reductase [Lysinibacillus contaminans]|uniref:dTDP-4-dehydrorhamnose reductase n=1 Tax=Lysinibacillus contaminans TaxID=1293441 RepID=A0ABR5JWU0_9BACI|nr:dTDP-4-dehydrorhamnose reductase [Lysinibacillus contaminans]KOS66616.1 dTDP-4-dehydrorhamnose reductase [Lysinibacillus contaminans]
MKIMVTGANGQLGQELVKQLSSSGHDLFAFTKTELDITDIEQVDAVCNDIRPNIIINAAAYTNVDGAETNQELAFQVNEIGQRNLAVAAEKIGAKICYISTDYVFNGQASSPYTEYMNVDPLGVYGQSKYAGEFLTKTLSTKYFIVRTAWVYGEFGPNFVKTMLKLAEEKTEIGVVHDQIGSPTYTVDLAEFLIELVQTEKYGIYHSTNSGTCSWYEFAKEIFKVTNKDIVVNPLTSEQFPRPAKRPAYSVLGDLSLRINGFTPRRHWKDALYEYINKNNNLL